MGSATAWLSAPCIKYVSGPNQGSQPCIKHHSCGASASFFVSSGHQPQGGLGFPASSGDQLSQRCSTLHLASTDFNQRPSRLPLHQASFSRHAGNATLHQESPQDSFHASLHRGGVSRPGQAGPQSAWLSLIQQVKKRGSHSQSSTAIITLIRHLSACVSECIDLYRMTRHRGDASSPSRCTCFARASFWRRASSYHSRIR